MTLRYKILSRMSLLTVLIILAMSASYYSLFTRDIRERSQQTVRQAYALIVDDLQGKVEAVRSQLDLFAQDSLMNPTFMVQMMREQQDSADTPSLWYVSQTLGYLRTLILQVDEFGGLVEAQQIEVYGKDGNLMAAFLQHGDTVESGVYLPDVIPGAFIPLTADDRWYAMLQSLDEIPQAPFPKQLQPQYQGEIPESESVAFHVSESFLHLRFVTPIRNDAALQGLCVLSLRLRQQDVERYARLSGTEVNIFSGDRLSVGTLREYHIPDFDTDEPSQHSSLLSVNETPPTQFSTIEAGGHSYYQGRVTLWERETPIAAVTVNFPRILEEQQKRRLFLMIAGIAVAFSLLAAVEALGLSSRIVKPLSHLMEAMQTMKSGNLDVEAPLESDDEIGRLAENFNSMTTRLRESFARIEQQNKELKELDRLKDEFLSNTSHELRTPLNGIAGLADAMLSGADGPLTDEERKHTLMILQSSKRLSKLVNSILDYSKAKSEQLHSKVRAFEIEQVADLVLTLARPEIKDRPVELSMDFPATLPKAYGDMDQIEQILTNLVGNAVKFTREGQVVVSAESCGFAASSQGESFVKITVHDTGIGIPEQAKPRIFTAFEQADGSSSREFGGTGLGLAITKELVQLHGGEIGVESEEGVGSSFWFTLPCTPEAIPSYQENTAHKKGLELELVEAVSPSPDPQTQSITREGEVLSDSGNTVPPLSSQRLGDEFISAPNKGKRIMIVDDDLVNLEVMDTHLTHAGLKTLRATNGKEAIEMINGETVDLILCDVMMPLVDGFTFAMRMQEKEQLRRTPLVFVSAKGEKADIMKGLRSGAVDYITKPIDNEELLLKIDSLLELKRKYSADNLGEALKAIVAQDREFPTDTEHDPKFLQIRRGKGEKILVVDDEEVNIEVFQSQLKQYNYEVIAADNGYEALRKLETEQPDLVLLDLMMPGLPGHKVCQEMRRAKNYYELPIIILTAKHEMKEKIYGLNIGANDYILKPFDKEELLTRIALLLQLSDLQKTVITRNIELEAEIIERRQAEEALRQLSAELEERVEQRTAELKVANSELNDFAHIISHDLKAPLRGVRRLVDWLREDYTETFDDKGRELLDLLVEQVTHMNDLIKGVLQYSKAARVGLQFEAFNMGHLMEGLLRSLAIPSHIHVTIEGELPTVKADRIRLTQVCQNLLSNALKFQDKPDGIVNISAEESESCWTIAIRDNGRGIAEEDHHKIFQLFQTLNTDDTFESSGVGLAVVKKNLDLHGGKIWIESAPGQGSTFFFSLPKEVEVVS